MPHLTDAEYKVTLHDPVVRVKNDQEPPFDFWPYFRAIPNAHFEGHDCAEGRVEYVYRTMSGAYTHVLVNSEDPNIFMVLVLNGERHEVTGHRLLNLNREYGLET